MELVNNKRCIKCTEVKDISEFRQGNICIPCIRINAFLCRSTFDGFFYTLFVLAKGSSEQRLKNKRYEAGVFNITLEYLKDLWNKQEGKCFYSGIQMQTKPSSDWKCSIERLDPNKGYIKENIVLACHELNNSTQWSIDKIKKLIELVRVEQNTDLIIEEIKEGIKKKPKRNPKKLEQKTIDNVEYYKCKFCDEYFSREEFVKEISKGCKKCRSINRKDYATSLRGKLKKIVNSAFSHTKRRQYSEKSINRIDNICTITFDDIFEILIKQGGLCAYSGIKMNYGSYLEENWTISLERINPLKGYTKENVCLICYEFNGIDHSADAKYSNGGSGSWNKEKFQFFLNLIKDKYKNETIIKLKIKV